MASRFDDFAKAVARGVTRRRALRAMLGGIGGAFFGTLLLGARTPAAEAGSGQAMTSALQQGPKWNQSHWTTNPRYQQIRARWNQTRARLNQTRPGINQRRRPGLNATKASTDPQVNQYRQRVVKEHPWFNQAHPRLNQSHPRFNQARPPGLNQVHRPRINSTQAPRVNTVRTPRINTTQGPRVNQVGPPQVNTVRGPRLNEVWSPQLNQTRKP